MGFEGETRAACGSSHWGMASATLMTVACVVLLCSYLIEVSAAMRRNLALAGIALPGVAIILQIVFWLGTGQQREGGATPLGYISVSAGSLTALWGFYLTFTLSLLTTLAGLLRLTQPGGESAA